MLLSLWGQGFDLSDSLLKYVKVKGEYAIIPCLENFQNDDHASW